MLSDPEPEPASPGLADEVRALEAELVEDSDGIRNALPHLVSVRGVRLVAVAEPAVIDVHELKPRSRAATALRLIHEGR
jgi:hypothetical protein